MKYLIIAIFLFNCSSNRVWEHCDYKFIETYYNKCMKQCNYPDDENFCHDRCTEVSEEKYCK